MPSFPVPPAGPGAVCTAPWRAWLLCGQGPVLPMRLGLGFPVQSRGSLSRTGVPYAEPWCHRGGEARPVPGASEQAGASRGHVALEQRTAGCPCGLALNVFPHLHRVHWPPGSHTQLVRLPDALLFRNNFSFTWEQSWEMGFGGKTIQSVRKLNSHCRSLNLLSALSQSCPRLPRRQCSSLGL